MGIYALIALINGIASSILGPLVYFKNPKETTHKTFGLFCLAVAVWGYAYFFWQISATEKVALFWSRGLMAGAVLIPIFYFHFVLALVNKIKKKKKLLIFGYLIFLFFFLANFTPWFIKGVTPKLNFAFWPNPGILYHPFLLVWFFYAFFTIYLLFKQYSISSGAQKAQLRYVSIGTVIGYLGGITNYLLWYDIPLPPIGNWAIALYMGIVAYAIVKYRLMDIRLAMSRGAIYVFSFLSVIASAFLMIFLNNRLAQPISFNVFFPMTIIVAVLLFQLFFRFFEKLGSKYFYYVFYSYQRVLTDLGRRLTRVLELKKLSALIASTLIRTMKLDRTIVLLRNPETGDYQIQKNIGFKEENGISLVRDNFLTRYLEKTQNPLVYEELSLVIRDIKDEKERKNLESLKKSMKKIKAALCLPLFREKKVIGMIVLGSKVSGDPYSQQDLELLATLSSQASIALQNARLYNQVQDLSQNLQQKVDEQTRELRRAYEELKKLDKAKSEFISIASHQLRTPLTAIKGYISMILEGDYGKLPGKAVKSMKNVYQSNERLIKLVNGLLSISRIEAGKMEIKKERMSIEPLIESLIEELKPQAQQKNLYLKFKKPKTKMPRLLADKEKLRQVLLNVLDNGLRYTTRGGVTVKLEIKNSKPFGSELRAELLKIIVSDTGEGMLEDELSKIFQTFSRGKAGAKLWVEGIGLGLYIAKRFIELQGGKIWAESSGKGKGSTFYVELPIG